MPNFPSDGQDLNPILQDPGLVSHPPMLYMGYVGFSVAFAIAMAALMSGQMDSRWARWARPWTLIAWSFLTLGIVLGSWWAYRELGWGGFWFWDPVENASFLPWLAGTALIHSLAVSEKRNAFKAWTALLAVCAFSLSLLGTFLVRSGVLISVHSFAVDPQRGLFMLKFLFVVIGGSLAVYAWRGRKIVTTNHFNFWSRETMLLSNNIILFVAMLTVLLGTLYPLIIDAMHYGKLSVGPPYFNTVLAPLMIPLFILMGVGPLLHWQTTDIRKLIKRFFYVCVFSIFLAFSLLWSAGAQMNLFVIFGLTLALWIITNTLSHYFVLQKRFRIRLRKLSLSQTAMTIAHVGVGITVVGLVLTTAYSQHRNLSMKIGDQIVVGSYHFNLRSIKNVRGPNYTATQAAITISQNNKIIKTLHPQHRQYTVQKTAIAKTDIDAGIFRDVYVALGESLSENAWAIRIYYKPFVRWIWFGGLMMVLAGIIAVFDRRYRRRGVK